MKTETKLPDGISGFLDKGINLNGELHFSSMLRIDGNFTGSILSEDRLVIGEHAVVRADITVGEIEIAGEVVGNIDAKKRAEVLASGRVHGDIRTPILSISPGSTGFSPGRGAVFTRNAPLVHAVSAGITNATGPGGGP